MIAEVDESGHLMSMVSGGSWPERVCCQLLCCLTKLGQYQGKVWKHRLQIIREIKQCLWHRYADDSFLFKNDIYPIPETLAQMIATEGITHECESFARYMPTTKMTSQVAQWSQISLVHAWRKGSPPLVA